MFQNIEWLVYVRAKTEEKAHRVIKRFGKLLGTDPTITLIEPYWKDKSMFAVRVTTPLGIDDTAQAVFQSLRISSTVARHWNVSAPDEYTGGKWEFRGWADSTSIIAVGVIAIEFGIRNFSYPYEDEQTVTSTDTPHSDYAIHLDD